MSTLKSSAEHLTLNADGSGNDIKFQSNATEVAAIDQAGNLTLSGTVDGVDIATRDAILTSTTTTAGAALPKAGGTLTGDLVISYAAGSSNWALSSTSGDDFTISRNGSQKLLIDGSTSNVGIGTSNPDAPLHVEATNASMLLSNSGRTQYWRIQNNESSDALVFNANDSAERMRIDSSGNVGIGTTTPNTKLVIINNTDTDYGISSGATNYGLSIVNTTSGANNSAGILLGTESNGEIYLSAVQNSGNSASDFRIATRHSGSRSDKFIVSSAGIVTAPYQPAAVAYSMPDSNNGTLVYSTEKFDNAGNMNLTNGRFTCPVAGVYSVSISGFYNSGRSNNGDVAIRVNNSLYVRASYSNESTSNYVAITGVSLVKVAANDYITIFTEGDMHGSDASVFSVHLVG